MYSVELEQVEKSFGTLRVVRELSLRVEPGERLAVLGPDGAGKTTTLRLIASLLRPDRGRIRVHTWDTVRDAPLVRRHIGYVPQRFSLYPDLTVRENLSFYADLFGVTGAERDRRLRDLLAFSRLAAFQDRRAGALSGGMQRKLALACALLPTPGLLLLDEPTNGLDPVSRQDFWDLLDDVHARGVTLLVSTTYMDEPERCDRVAFLYEGRLLALDTPEGLKDRYPFWVLAVYTPPPAFAYLHRVQSVIQTSHPAIVGVQAFGDRLHVVVRDVAAGREALTRLLTGPTSAAVGVEVVRPSLEDVFLYLTEQVRGAHRERAGH
ncbi:putative ABC transporter ATP-binding protein YbhF [bacterium HR11]|nr:putative ABC transporter ATP-binding protein YbhF [bacterium HR11]